MSTACAIVLSTALIGCRSDPPKHYQPAFSSAPPAAAASVLEYRLGVPPMRTTRDLWSRYDPVVDCLNTGVKDFKVRLESALTSESYDEKLRKSELDFAFVEPHRVLEFEDLGYQVLARAGNRDRIAGVLIVRADGEIHRQRDLKTKNIYFSSRTALALSLIKAEMKEAGVDPAQVHLNYADNEQSALMHIIAGTADAAGVSRSGWERYQIQEKESAQQLRVLHRTQELPGVAVMAHKRVPAQHVQQLAAALMGMAAADPGRVALHGAGFTEFHHGESASYDELWEFLTKYRRLFGTAPKRLSS